MTSPSTIRDLRTALEELEEKKREIDEQYRNVAAALRYFEESVQEPRPRMEEASKSNLGDAIYEVLKEDRPLHRQQVYGRLVEMGVRVGGLPSVDSQLSRDPRFRNVGKGMWDLSDPTARDERVTWRCGTGRVPKSELPARDESEEARVSNLGDAIYQILTAERPLHRRQVHERLVEMGRTIPGRDPVNNVGAHMSLDPRFMSVGGGVWDLAGPPEHDESGRPEPVDFDDETGRPGRELEDDDDQYEGDEEDSVPW